MSKHEIRLRRQKLTARGADRFRNYGAVLHRHEQEMKMKRIVRIFVYFLITLVVIMLLLILTRVERRAKATNTSVASKMYNFHMPFSVRNQ